MKFAFDLHGVINIYPEFYKKVMSRLIKANVEVFVISGPPAYQVEKELTRLNVIKDVHYNKIIGVVDYLVDNNNEYKIDEGGNYWFDEKVWWSSKSKICKENDISMIFDNDKKYKEYFDKNHKTVFILCGESDI